MNRKFLYTAWAVLFILCAAFGFVPERSGVLQALLTVLSLVFFLPSEAEKLDSTQSARSKSG